MTDLNFPPDFLWGTASSSYQIEGASTEDGRGATIWDTFSDTPGNVIDNDTGDVACDHYHLWRDDIALMKSLNLEAYRFSIAWSRIFPDGRGSVNQAGLDWYSRLVDGLLDAGITPFVTLYHWDLPQALQDDGGGWLRRGIIDDFTAYADMVSRALGDRVKHWITFNEPWVFNWIGYGMRRHAPGLNGGAKLALPAAHHTLVAHGRTVPILRANVADAVVGITLNLNHVDPASPVAHDMQAAARFDGFHNRWYLDPIFRGHYPHDMVETYGDDMPTVEQGDMAAIHQPLDFLGVNNYFRSVIADDPDAPILGFKDAPPEGERTAMGWEVYPRGLYFLLKRLHEEYAPKAIYITENGAAFPDTLNADGSVEDAQRVSYLERHFESAAHAIADGVPLKGYFVWSLLDNFEWEKGYSMRFGIVYVDYTTLKRYPKASAHRVAEIAAATRARG